MPKPIVHYKPTPADQIIEGRSAWLFHVLDHPSDLVSNTEGTAVHTSIVIHCQEDYFETANTIYKPRV